MMSVWCHIIIFGAIFAIVCNLPAEKVILEQVGDFGGCPGDPISFNCSVHSQNLVWKCPDGSERVVQCRNNLNNILPLECQNKTLTVYFLDDRCTTTSNGGTLLTSTIEFNASSYQVICEDVDNSSVYNTTTIPFAIPPPPALNLSDQIKGLDDINLRIITVFWQEPNTFPHGIYSITVEPAIQECNTTCETEQQQLELKLALETAYNVTVIAVICNGSLKSEESKPLEVFLQVPPVVASCNATFLNNDSLQVQWPTMHDLFHLYYILTYDVNDDIMSQRILSKDCTGICIYNITEKSASNISVMGVNDVGIGEKTLCNISYSPAGSNLIATAITLSLVLMLAFLTLYILQPLPFLVYKKCWEKMVQEQEEQVVKEAPMKMEAGRSVVHKENIYFASYRSKQIYCYSAGEKTPSWTPHGNPMYYINSGLAIIHECVAAIGGQEKSIPTNEVWVWKNQNWVPHKSMIHKKSDPAVITCTITSTEKKYIIVINGNNHTVHALHWKSCVEVYDEDEDEWKEVCSLPSPYSRIEAILCRDMVYVFPDTYHSAVTCHLTELVQSEIDRDVWKVIKNVPLRYSTPATLNDTIICVGGADETKDGRRDIYEYNEGGNHWYKIGELKGDGRMYSMVEVYGNKCVVVGGILTLPDDKPQRLDMPDNDNHEPLRLNTVTVFTKRCLPPKKKEKSV